MKERCAKSAKACLLKNEYLITCAINRENDNNHRKKAALERGLPETVTWNDITIYNLGSSYNTSFIIEKIN